MAVYCKLWKPLWCWSCKYQRRAFCMILHNETDKFVNKEESEYLGNRKTVNLKKIIATYPDLYNEIIKNEPSSKDWENIRKTMLQNSLVTDMTIDSTIIDLCVHELHVDNAMKYYWFLKEHDYPLHVAIIGKYLRLFILKGDSLTNADKQEIVAICEDLMKKYPCLDSITAEYCVSSLCLTDQWERSMEIINMMQLTMKPGITVYSMLASAAFQHDKPDIGWNAIQQMILRSLRPQNITYKSYLEYCEHKQKLFDERFEKMFSFWADSGDKPYNSMLDAYAKVANRHGWSTAPTSFSKTGQCKICLNQLSDLKFSQETFKELTNVFMKKVIVGSDIYHKSNPKELQMFIKFVEKTKPYDVVIDGLNITYALYPGQRRPDILINLIQYFVKRKQKVLVLTRKHQKNLPILGMQNVFVFYTTNMSSDDPYLLYATLVSGEKAMFVSLDLMRQYKYLLEDKYLQLVFKKWQCSHQYSVKFNGTCIQVRKPFNFIPHAQKNFDSWHIPYINDNSTNSETYEFPDKWYCFHKKYET